MTDHPRPVCDECEGRGYTIDLGGSMVQEKTCSRCGGNHPVSDQPRPVWLTREQRESLRGGVGSTVEQIEKQWDAAPDDAEEAVRKALWWPPMGPSPAYYHDQPIAVLRALGVPSA